MEDIMANYSKIIAKALGKRRMKKIITIDAWGDLMIDIPMKNGWTNDNEETTIFGGYRNRPNRPRPYRAIMSSLVRSSRSWDNLS